MERTVKERAFLVGVDVYQVNISMQPIIGKGFHLFYIYVVVKGVVWGHARKNACSKY
jgi:hypothetical protein